MSASRVTVCGATEGREAGVCGIRGPDCWGRPPEPGQASLVLRPLVHPRAPRTASIPFNVFLQPSFVPWWLRIMGEADGQSHRTVSLTICLCPALWLCLELFARPSCHNRWYDASVPAISVATL